VPGLRPWGRALDPHMLGVNLKCSGSAGKSGIATLEGLRDG
jgi:hypothetical protein